MIRTVMRNARLIAYMWLAWAAFIFVLVSPWLPKIIERGDEWRLALAVAGGSFWLAVLVAPDDFDFGA